MKALMLDIRKKFAMDGWEVVFGFDNGGGICNHHFSLDRANPPFPATDLQPEDVRDLISFLNEYLKEAENGEHNH